MSYPQFLAIDASSPEDDSQAIAIAWSTPDGLVKTTLIQPDGDWFGLDYAVADMHGISEDTLYQRGETAWSVIRELESDMEQSILYCANHYQTMRLLEKLYETCDRELNIELLELEEVISDSIDDSFEYSYACDQRVREFLLIWHQVHEG